MTERKVYTEEFKRDAVRLAAERGNIAQTARDLGISDNTLQGWKRQLQETPNNPFPATATRVMWKSPRRSAKWRVCARRTRS